MYIKSNIDKGTYFRLEFHLKRLENIKEEQTNALQPNKSLLQNKHICLVEDDELILKLLTKVLTSYGAKITSFSNPQEALNTLKIIDHIDLFIFDYKMREMTGYELLQQLKAKHHDLSPTIISTANTMLSDEEKSHISAFDDKIFKPLKTKKLIDKVCDLLNIKQTHQTQDEKNPVEISEKNTL